MEKSNREEIIPTVSYSLAAIVRKEKKRQQKPNDNDTKYPQEYVLVHERPPRGWWLPGGGVEHHDLTPVDAAIRESVEEAGCGARLLPLLPSFETSSTTNDDYTSKVLPSMTHLISLEQSPRRIRFIFRGEWIDGDSIDNNSILKCIPDDESIEAKWITFNEVQCLEERKRGSSTTQNRFSMSDPWLRGHEPKTFFGLLESSWQEDEPIPGLQVHKINFSGDIDIQQEDVTGAFFGRCTGNTSEKMIDDLSYNGRAALMTRLKCHLIVYNKVQKAFTIDSSFVSNQHEMTLKELVDCMLARYTSLPYEENNVGLLRVEHVIHDNGWQATLIVFPFVYLSATDVAHEATSWLPIDELSDPLDRRLAEIVMDDDRRRGICLNLDILRDTEGPRKQKHIPNNLSAQDRAWLRNVGS